MIVFSLKVHNLLTISLKIFKFWIKIKDSNQREWKNPREKEKISVNGKIPLDKSWWMEKSRGNLVMCERNCLRLKNPCFIQEWSFKKIKIIVCLQKLKIINNLILICTSEILKCCTFNTIFRQHNKIPYLYHDWLRIKK